MTSKNSLQEKLTHEYTYADLHLSQDNKMNDMSCLTCTDIEKAEKALNEKGYTIAGLCTDVPLSVSTGLNGYCVLVITNMLNQELYWLPCFDCVINNWLER